MNRFSCGLIAATLALFAGAATAREAEPVVAMPAVPVHLIVPAVPLRPTMPLLFKSENAGLRSYNTYPRIFGNASRSPKSLMFRWAEFKDETHALALPAYRTLREAGCLITDADVFAQMIGDAVHATPGFAEVPVEKEPWAPENTLPGDRTQPRIEVVAIHTFTPEYSALITSVTLSAYSPNLPGAPRKWQDKPAFERDLAVVSDRVDPPESLELVAAAARRGELWSQDQCARVHAAIAANRIEAARLLQLALSGALPTDLPADWEMNRWTGKATHNLATDPTEAVQRRLYSDEPNLVVSRRAGDDVMTDFRSSWVPSDAEEQADAKAAKQAGKN